MNPDLIENIINKINHKKVTIGVIGLGYVGLPLSILIAKKGFKIFGFDNDKNKINKIQNGRSYLDRIKKEDINILRRKGIFYTNFKKLYLCDFIIIAVPTPLKNNKPNLEFVRKTVKLIKKYLRKGQTIILESTSYPGTTREEIVEKIVKFTSGKDIFVGFSSERINPGINENQINKIPKVISGYSDNCVFLISKLYGKIFNKIVKARTLEIAEFSKLLENIYRSVNIGFINEMKLIADRMGCDIYEILKIAETKPYGFVRFNPGPGIGGHCIPIDPNFLYWKAKKKGISAKFIKLSAETNLKILDYLKKIVIKINKKSKINKNKFKILILGITYKKNVDDLRESSSLNLIKKLKKNNFSKIYFSDPFVKSKPKTRDFGSSIKKIDINSRNLKKFDLTILMTDHDNFDYKKIYNNSKLILDTRGRYKVDQKVIRG